MSDVAKTCPACGLFSPADHQFCRKCGHVLTERAAQAPPVDATVRWANVTPAGGLVRSVPVDVFSSKSGELHRSIKVAELFGGRDRLVIGRSARCDICLPHSSVSREHAWLERLSNGLRLHDCGSINGVRVGGRRISEPVILGEHERVGIGPYLFCLSGGFVHSLDSSRSLRLEARHLEKTICLAGGRTRKLLDNINLAVEPGEFVSLLGPSGSGKSTLMDCLNGRRPATRGRVLANGEDFYLHFDSFRQSLGYVPQRDIVHTQLSVYKALFYTARLRLPTDTDPAELRARIHEVVRLMELEPHQDTLVGNLSGGQIKRVSLGAELLARPCLLYIDEATSGLDAGTEARMMRLFRQLANEGRSVICITHNVDNVDLCNLILVLAAGKLVFYGPPQDGRAYFGVQRTSDIYDCLGSKSPAEWEKQFTACSLHREYVESRLAAPPAGSIMMLAPPQPELAAPTPPRAAMLGVQTERPHRVAKHQFRVLTARYAEMIWRDSRTLRLLLLQAPIVAVFILLGFINKPYEQKILAPRQLTDSERESLTLSLALGQAAEDSLLQAEPFLLWLTVDRAWPERLAWVRARVHWADEQLRMFLDSEGPVIPDRVIINPRYTYVLLFILVIAILWFGCNNAAREIVKEEAIYARERAVNLGILPYLASKFLILSLITAVQTALMMLILYGVLEFLGVAWGWEVPAPLYRMEYVPQFAVLVMLGMTGVALGLLLSACVTSPDRATTLLPYVLIPQIILAGGILPVKGEPLHTLATLFSPAYWGYRAARLGETDIPGDFPGHMDYHDDPWLACGALVLQTTVLLLATAWFLRRKDVRRG